MGSISDQRRDSLHGSFVQNEILYTEVSFNVVIVKQQRTTVPLTCWVDEHDVRCDLLLASHLPACGVHSFLSLNSMSWQTRQGYAGTFLTHLS